MTWGEDADGNGVVSPLDPSDAIMAQGNFMCALYDQVSVATADGRISGDPFDLALASYNAGFGNVTKFGDVPPFKETQNYIARIRSLIGRYSAASSNPLPGSSIGEQIVAAGETQLGVPYSWGGGGPNGPSTGSGSGANTAGFDCSHFVWYATYQASGGSLNILPRPTPKPRPGPKSSTAPVGPQSTTRACSPATSSPSAKAEAAPTTTSASTSAMGE
ncbi:hypothetical protein [Xylanimonas allomyrinae]|uniref:hypothetical protein n=1 Tax=Xylanimonas allomyrinae TaxID=2509459 RepID=UPI001FEBDEE6|nr:hypothetical protein [Xylanimonas allomyrinae]